LSIGTSSWVFAILFAQTVSAILPLYQPDVVCATGSADDHGSVCGTRYIINLILLGVITTPLALMDVKEQAIIQNTLAVTRVLRCALMIATPLMATSQLELQRGFPFADSAHAAQTPIVSGSVDGVFIILSVCVFSFFLNSSVPIFIDALRNVKHALKILVWGFLITAGMYWVLSAVGSVTFGSSISTTCNLAWKGFRWPFMTECAAGSVCDVTSRMVEVLVVFSPVLDVISVYPLGTIVLANSAWEVVFGVPHHEFGGSIDQILVDHYLPPARALENRTASDPATPAAIVAPSPSETTRLLPGDAAADGAAEARSGRWCGISRQAFLKKLVRFVLNILPLLLAVVVQNFLQIVTLAGSISVLICLVFPAYLSLKCSSYEEEHGIPAKTVNADNHLHWCDSPMPTLFPGHERAKKIESNDNETNSDSDVEFGYDPESSFIEKRWFKLAVIYLGLVVTLIIFYSSITPVPGLPGAAHHHRAHPKF
jgi:hypothetical protein